VRWSAAALLVIALVGCSGEGESPAPTPTTPASAQAFPEPGTGTLDPAKAKALQNVVDMVIASPDAPTGSRGATAAVVTDRWTWTGAAGTDIRGTPLRPETAMAAGDITMTFVAAEVMLLAKAGKVDLDKPISTYVPHKLTANNATVRQHLSMTSGVPDFGGDDFLKLDKAVAAAPSKHWTIEETLAYNSAQVGAPGSPFAYSATSYALLGLLIEKVTGEPYAGVLRRDLATPAGLNHVAFQDGEKPLPPAAVDDNYSCGAPDGYLPCRGWASAAGPVAGLAADAPALARWGYQLYGARVLPTELVSEMTKGGGEYGLGTAFFPDDVGIGRTYGHGGGTPDHSSLLMVLPGKKVSAALLFADGDRNVGKAMTDLMQALQPLLN